MSDVQMYLPDYVRQVAQSGHMNHIQHANHVELLADFAAERDKEFYALRNECNDLKTVAFHLGEDKRELLEANTKLVGALNLIRETLNGGEVQDLHQIINAALVAHDATTETANAKVRAQETEMETWFLLFGGSSPDGRGQPDFVGRTKDKAKARKHYEACRKDPYSTGNVWIVTNHGYEIASAQTDWDALKPSVGRLVLDALHFTRTSAERKLLCGDCVESWNR